MCCAFTTLLLVGPRAAAVIWYLVQPGRWAQAFPGGLLLPLLGVLILPWATLAYVFVAPGGIAGLDWLWLGIALLVDLSSYGGGAYGNRGRYRR